MGRLKQIDRDFLLDTAELIIEKEGIAKLTIGILASRAGVTKGGVQYAFGDKDGLIKAMIDRWFEYFDKEQTKIAKNGKNELENYIKVIKNDSVKHSPKASVMLAALLQNSDNLQSTKEWYATKLINVDANSTTGKKLRLAFFASEGIFMLRNFGYMDIDKNLWSDTFKDIDEMLLNNGI